jgi:hypothetical protein
MNRTTDLPKSGSAELLKSGSITRFAQLALFAAMLAAPTISVVAAAQAPAAAAPASRLIGAVTAINGTTLTIKTDAGQSSQVDVPSAAVIKRIAPGQKDLSTADTLQFSDLAVGDRVLIKLDPSANSGNSQALQIIAVKQADIQEKQSKDREDWQRNGLGGLVKSVDAGSGVIVLTTGTGANSKTITVNTSASTMLKRYAPASVSFDAAQPAAIGVIHPGDQLRARGTKSADGSNIAAVEVVSGTFRNISGTVDSTDPAGSTVVVKDLATKKLVTIHITPEVQMRKLSDRMAGFLAARLKSGAAGAATHAGAAGAGGTSGAGQSGGAQGGGGLSGDPQQLLNRAPVIQIADLKKGDAVMLVATDGTTDVTAITLVAGVEALLQAPAETQNLLNNWSMGSGSGAAEAAQ